LLYAIQIANHNAANLEQITGIVSTNKDRILMVIKSAFAKTKPYKSIL